MKLFRKTNDQYPELYRLFLLNPSGKESEMVRFYLQHHLKEFTEDIIMEIFGTTNIDKQTFFKHLKLYRVGLYPDDDESYAIFDIQLPKKYTNYLMAVTFDSDGEFSCISMES